MHFIPPCAIRLYPDTPRKGPAICGVWGVVAPRTRLEAGEITIRELNGVSEIVLAVRYRDAPHYVLVHEILDTQLADLCSWWKCLVKVEPEAHRGVFEKIETHLRHMYMRGSLSAVS